MDNPYQAPSQQTPQVALAPGTRPVTATVFGILNLVFGGFGFCGGVAGAVVLFLINNGIIDIEMAEISNNQFEDPIYSMYLFGNTLVSVALTGVLIASGIGLLKFKPWGRRLGNYYAVLAIILGVVAIGMQIGYALVPNLGNLDSMPPQQQAAIISGSVGGTIGGCIGMIYPISLLVFLNRRVFREQIAG